MCMCVYFLCKFLVLIIVLINLILFFFPFDLIIIEINNVTLFLIHSLIVCMRVCVCIAIIFKFHNFFSFFLLFNKIIFGNYKTKMSENNLSSIHYYQHHYQPPNSPKKHIVILNGLFCLKTK